MFWRDCVEDDQLPATTLAWDCEDTRWLIGIVGRVVTGVIPIRCPHSEQRPDPGDISRTVAISEEAIVANAMLTFWQDVGEEPADEL